MHRSSLAPWPGTAAWLLVMLLALAAPENLCAHGAMIDVSQTTGVVIQAGYDTGQPMSEAQVTVYAPDNPATPWKTGQTDADGRFSFVPDPAIPGTWAIQARQAGHGAMGHIRIDSPRDAPSEPSSHVLSHPETRLPSGVTPWQRALMIGSVVWGCVGTALFFSRRKPFCR